ncbi:gp40 [Listeria phage P35]|uniref:Uncharacterized protein n=1 Tax=Listeria phage LP-083-1 TaxID=1458854 RepID=A0A059T880_9CAUD|nr:gp40 [Listeria phage P35]AAY53225.1 gp40 [Listeria phage P35]AHL19005.1 hypothetical protein LP083-1_040 [Listeria phage LP-083-1]
MNKMTVEKVEFGVMDTELMQEKSAEDLLLILKNINEARKAITETQHRVLTELENRGLKPISEVLCR